MKIRSTENLLDRIDDDIARRKKEIITLKNMLITARKASKDILAKSLVLIAYSHWEGFVKTSTTYFLVFLKTLAVSRDKLSTKLRSTISYWAIRKEGQNNIKDSISLMCSLIEKPQERRNIYIDDIVDTKSNLNDDVLERIALSIGLDVNSFRPKYPFINAVLLDNRNHLAHGDYRDVDEDNAKQIADQVITLMDMYYNAIQDYIINKKYLNS
jgi:hypothetical protein